MIRDSFDVANKIKSVPPEVFDGWYIFASFDAESLFTNVPLQATIKIILDRVYNDKLIATQLKKRPLKKLIKDTCSKTVFFVNNKLYQLIDGASMSGFLGPLLGNIIMTEIEKTIIKTFIDDGALVVIKREHLKFVHDALSNFEKILNFIIDTFDNVVLHFLDIKIHPDGLSI